MNEWGCWGLKVGLDVCQGEDVGVFLVHVEQVHGVGGLVAIEDAFFDDDHAVCRSDRGAARVCSGRGGLRRATLRSNPACPNLPDPSRSAGALHH